MQASAAMATAANTHTKLQNYGVWPEGCK